MNSVPSAKPTSWTPTSNTIVPAADRAELAKLLFPDHATLPTMAQLEAQYPERTLPEGAIVCRIAPSPTGFAHIGLVYMALINRRFAAQTKGVFILRVEDTDEKREIAGALETIVDVLRIYSQEPDEGVLRSANGDLEQKGSYGPYIQSERKRVYRACAMHLVQSGFAYPCFCSAEELEVAAKEQIAQKLRPGYYGYYAKWRDRSLAEIREELAKGTPFVIRLRSWGEPNQRVQWSDGVKGKMSVPVNDTDAVILKSDGQSLYHLAHAMDDHFMRVTHVMRGDEWISSVPLHIQIFQAFGWQHPHYSHLSTIQKLDTVTEVDPETGAEVTRVSKRKLAKRKDPEANAMFYLKEGFPPESINEYLTNIANSDFEDWRRANPMAPLADFQLKLNKLSPSAALSDPVKLASVSKEVIGRMPIEPLYAAGLEYSQRNDPEIAALMAGNAAYAKAALNIERDGKKPSKRIGTWKDLRAQLGWFFDEVYSKFTAFPFPENVTPEARAKIVERFLATYSAADGRDEWFAKCKVVATEVGFAAEMKEFKASPGAFPGHIGDVTNVLRVAVCGSRESPDLCEVMKVLGAERVTARLRKFL